MFEDLIISRREHEYVPDVIVEEKSAFWDFDNPPPASMDVPLTRQPMAKPLKYDSCHSAFGMQPKADFKGNLHDSKWRRKEANRAKADVSYSGGGEYAEIASRLGSVVPSPALLEI